MNILVIEVLTY